MLDFSSQINNNIVSLKPAIAMKKYLYILFILISVSSFAQQNDFIEINGQILVESNDVEGITIYNSTGKKGTITNANGEFKIAVRLNDSIKIRALQYQDFNIVVNQEIIKNKILQVYLIEEVNKLDEIIIRDMKLVGNLEEDLETFAPKSNILYFSFNNTDKLSLEDKAPSLSVNNELLISQERTLVNGLNIVNIVDQLLIPLFRSEVDNKKEKGIPDVPANSIKYYFGSKFLVDNFNIPSHRVEEFIRFVESENFDFSLLNYGNEMQLLEIINKKSKEFLSKKP